ncbi:MAG: BamA/TamA family outer membrane protein [Planctomycetes bacterium]|nr:BamA/TamA family outer membrane protein [Planctomycetota bacterium]
MGVVAGRGRVAGWVALCAALLPALGGCTLPIQRGPVADFFVKDYDLPPYRAETARLGRWRHEGRPTATSAALGGIAGAVSGGRLRAWRAAASGSLGGIAGAAAARVLRQTQDDPPQPEAYEVLTLALPIIATDPNKGLTFGLLPVVVFQEQARITNILAPDVTYNAIDGIGGSFRMRRFFSSTSSLALDVMGSSEGAFDNEMIYAQRRVGPREFLFYRGHVAYKTDLSTRFYGIGNDTKDDDETSYVFRRGLAVAALGIQLPLHFTAEFQERIASYKIGPGRLEKTPSSRARFPDVPGMRDRINVLTHRIRLTFDTRDSLSAPTRGVFGEFIYDVADETLGSTVGFHRFGLFFTALIPKLKGRLTTVVRVGGWIVEGRNVPFFEQSSLGGKATNRGYGDGRFVDQNMWLLNLEERWNVTSFELMGVRNVLQLAAFVDVGRVLSERDRFFTVEDAKISVGGALRLLVPDSELVTSIDVGFSEEGPAAFVGLDYPF